MGRFHHHCNSHVCTCNYTHNDSDNNDEIYDFLVTERIFHNNKDGCVTVTTENGLNGGSGFFLTKDGYIYTNAHVVLRDRGLLPNNIPKNNIMVKLNNGNRIRNFNIWVSCKVIGVDRGSDSAILKVKTKEEDPVNGADIFAQKYLRWGDSERVRTGETVILIGNLALSNNLNPLMGMVSDKRYVNMPHVTAIESVLTTANTFGGMSGSPILCEGGRVIGVNGFSIFIDGKEVRGLGGGTSQHILEPVSKYIIENGIDYDQKGYLGVSELSSLTVSIWMQIVNIFPNFTKISKGNGVIISKIDEDNVMVGRGVLYAKPYSLKIFDVITAIRLKGGRWLNIGDDGYRLYPTSHITWLHPSGTELEVEFIRLGEVEKRKSILILAEFPNELDVVGTSAQSIVIQKDIEIRLIERLKDLQ